MLYNYKKERGGVFMIKIFITPKSNNTTATFEEKVLSLPFGDAEKQRLLSMKNKDAANASLSAYIALQKLSKDIEEDLPLTISRSSHGKPFFEKLPGIPFSISHSGDLSVAAVCFDENAQSIGVDIEFKKGNLKFKKIADRFFGDEKEPQNEEEFLILWTKKEAFSKMCGGALTDVISLPAKNDIPCFKIIFDGKIAYMSICCDSAQKIEIEHDCDNISITNL